MISENDLNKIIDLLKKGLDSNSNVRLSAEREIKEFELKPNYLFLMLTIISKADLEPLVRLSAAILFKHFIQKNWKENFEIEISVTDKDIIKEQLIDILTKVPDNVQKQLNVAICLIGKEDFPLKWPSFLQYIIKKLQSGDLIVINRVLQCVNTMFDKYCHEEKSDQLWLEIKYVLTNFALPLTELYKETLNLFDQYASNPNATQVITQTLVLIADIYYSLIYQDLPEYFEDNLSIWMDNYLRMLTWKDKETENQDLDEYSLTALKTKICKIAMIYLQKYEEEFKRYTISFFEMIWKLLIQLHNGPRNDILFISGMEYVSLVIKKCETLKDLLPAVISESSSVLSHTPPVDWKAVFCQKVFNGLILPNIVLRENDVENFEDNPYEYIRFDLESSDVGTRRKACADFIKALKHKFSSSTISDSVLDANVFVKNFSQFAQSLFARYAENRTQEWKSKDLAMYIYHCLLPPPAIPFERNISLSTIQELVLKTPELNDALSFLNQHVLPEIVEGPGTEALTLLKANCLKYLILYRNLLAPTDPTNFTHAARQIILLFLAHPSVVVHSYAAIFVEKALISSPKIDIHPNSKTLLLPESIKDIVPSLIENLFLSNYPNTSENEFLMKALMRSLLTLNQYIPQSVITIIISKLMDILGRISKNPSKPYFNQYLFETLCISITLYPTLLPSYQEPLLTLFQELIKNDIQEFVPYTFQIMAAMIENVDAAAPNSRIYLDNLLPSILIPQIWEKPGYIPALVRLLIAYFYKFEAVLSEDSPRILSILGVFQKLLSSRANDHEGIRLLKALYKYFPREKLDTYTKQIFFVLFQRLQLAKTIKYTKELVLFFNFYICTVSSSKFYTTLESIQPGMFRMTLEKIYLPNLNLMIKLDDKKLCCLALTKILNELPEFKVQENPELWCLILKSLVKLLEDQTLNFAGNGSIADNTMQDELLDPHVFGEEEYQAAFSKLASLPDTISNNKGIGEIQLPTKEVTQTVLGQSLTVLLAQVPQEKINQMLSTLDNETKDFLQQYMTKIK